MLHSTKPHCVRVSDLPGEQKAAMSGHLATLAGKYGPVVFTVACHAFNLQGALANVRLAARRSPVMPPLTFQQHDDVIQENLAELLAMLATALQLNHEQVLSCCKELESATDMIALDAGYGDMSAAAAELEARVAVARPAGA